jgi:ABC-2 type transport system ATP-binding protein
MRDGTGAAVLAEGLVKHYTGREGTVEAVRGVDLEIHAGEIFGFLAPNGAPNAAQVTRTLRPCSARAFRSPREAGARPPGPRSRDPRRHV